MGGHLCSNKQIKIMLRQIMRVHMCVLVFSCVAMHMGMCMDVWACVLACMLSPCVLTHVLLSCVVTCMATACVWLVSNSSNIVMACIVMAYRVIGYRGMALVSGWFLAQQVFEKHTKKRCFTR